uniref:Uncharacterized protein n=1 Tax=Romanomermis culicivorax TaxID=13658 RepID=A0A915IQZ5_ROMCU
MHKRKREQYTEKTKEKRTTYKENIRRISLKAFYKKLTTENRLSRTMDLPTHTLTQPLRKATSTKP